MKAFLTEIRTVGIWKLAAVASLTVHIVSTFAPVTFGVWVGALIGALIPPALAILWERRAVRKLDARFAAEQRMWEGR